MEKVRAGRSGGIRPTFISDYLERHGPHGWVTVRPGAWNTGTGFVQWTGSLAQQQALTRVAALSEAVHAARRNAIAIGAGNPDLYRHLEDALTLVLRAETSCNFSWGEARVQRCHDDLDPSHPAPRTSRETVPLTTPLGAQSDAHDHDSPAHSPTRSRPTH